MDIAPPAPSRESVVARLQPVGLALFGDKLYFSEATTSQLRFVDLKTNWVSTLVRSPSGPGSRDGPINATASLASLRDPAGLVASAAGASLYITDASGRQIRTLQLAPQLWSTARQDGSVSGSVAANYERSVDSEESSAQASVAVSAPLLRQWQSILFGICGVVVFAGVVAGVALSSKRVRSRLHGLKAFLRIHDAQRNLAPQPGTASATAGVSTRHSPSTRALKYMVESPPMRRAAFEEAGEPDADAAQTNQAEEVEALDLSDVGFLFGVDGHTGSRASPAELPREGLDLDSIWKCQD
jgi:hypothetical protein